MSELSKQDSSDGEGEYPFGRTEYKNYDPDQLETPQDLAEFFDWLAEQNCEEDSVTAATVYTDCSNLIREILILDEEAETKDAASTQADAGDQE